MQPQFKPSTGWIIAGILFGLFLINHWMSREISKPTTSATVVEDMSSNAPQQQTHTLNIPQIPIQEEAVVVETPFNKSKPQKTTEEESQGSSEPIYDPPSNSVILVQ